VHGSNQFKAALQVLALASSAITIMSTNCDIFKTVISWTPLFIVIASPIPRYAESLHAASFFK
jgi:hypothetical protein